LEAFQELLDSNILSAPVWDEEAQCFVGYLCVQDLVTYIVILEHEEKLKSEGVDLETILKHASPKEKSLRVTRTKSRLMREESQAPGAFVKYFSSEHLLRPLKLNSNLLEAAERLVTGDKRVAVMDEEADPNPSPN